MFNVYSSEDLSRHLKNIGPKLAAKMIEAGIDTPENLRKLGARKAYRKMYENGDEYAILMQRICMHWRAQFGIVTGLIFPPPSRKNARRMLMNYRKTEVEVLICELSEVSCLGTSHVNRCLPAYNAVSGSRRISY